LSKSEIDEVITIGGTSRIPAIQDMLQVYFGGKSSLIKNEINPEEAIALGAANEAGFYSGLQ